MLLICFLSRLSLPAGDSFNRVSEHKQRFSRIMSLAAFSRISDNLQLYQLPEMQYYSVKTWEDVTG